MTDQKQFWRDLADRNVSNISFEHEQILKLAGQIAQAAMLPSVAAQTGRRSYNELGFYVMIKEIEALLEPDEMDKVLDVGGGVGWVTWCIAPQVGSITLVDNSPLSIAQARETFKAWQGIEIIESDILDFETTDRFDKVLSASTTEYLVTEDNLISVIVKLHGLLNRGGRAVFTQHPDAEKRDYYIDKYKLDLAQVAEHDVLWTSRARFVEICLDAGFKTAVVSDLDHRLWQWDHMFNVVAEK